jgi:3-isopropylmalate dehydrogenase
MTAKILLLPGDGVGPEICREAVRVLETLRRDHGLDVELEEALVGGAAVDAGGDPLPEETLEQARAADAILFGAVGGAQWDELPREQRPESGLLRLRSELELFANLRPAMLYPQLVHASTLREEVVSGLDIMIVRELTGGIYFGQPRETRTDIGGRRQAVNTMLYTDEEIERIARVAFGIAKRRGGRLCSVDKANVLEVSQLWREVVTEVAGDFPEVELSHMYVDNAAMQLVRDPKQFDTLVTGNLFGDILSDIAAMLTGSIGMLPSASLGASGKGLYEPVHGSAPDIAGQGVANPLAMILSLAMMLRHTLEHPALAEKVERAVGGVLDGGLRTRDIMDDGKRAGTTEEMGAAVSDMLE